MYCCFALWEQLVGHFTVKKWDGKGVAERRAPPRIPGRVGARGPHAITYRPPLAVTGPLKALCQGTPAPKATYFSESLSEPLPLQPATLAML